VSQFTSLSIHLSLSEMAKGLVRVVPRELLLYLSPWVLWVQRWSWQHAGESQPQTGKQKGEQQTV